jgi:hypothetical protein
MAAKPSSKSLKAVAASKAKGASFTTAKPTGASLSGLKAAKPPVRTAPAAPAKSTAAAAPTAPPPFLTPAEQAAWQKYQGSYADRIGNINPDSLAGAAPDQITQALINGGGTLGQQLSAGQSRFTSGIGNAQQSHDINTDMTNQATAARGLFQSSIRDGDLNDIDATLATRNAALNTAWSSLQTRVGTAYNQAVRDYGTTSDYYSGLGVSNAQAGDTGLPGPSTGTSTTSGAAAAGTTTTLSAPKPIAQPGPAWNAGAGTMLGKAIKPPKPAAPKQPTTGASLSFGGTAPGAGVAGRA